MGANDNMSSSGSDIEAQQPQKGGKSCMLIIIISVLLVVVIAVVVIIICCCCCTNTTQEETKTLALMNKISGTDKTAAKKQDWTDAQAQYLKLATVAERKDQWKKDLKAATDACAKDAATKDACEKKLAVAADPYVADKGSITILWFTAIYSEAKVKEVFDDMKTGSRLAKKKFVEAGKALETLKVPATELANVFFQNANESFSVDLEAIDRSKIAKFIGFKFSTATPPVATLAAPTAVTGANPVSVQEGIDLITGVTPAGSITSARLVFAATYIASKPQ